MAKYCPQCYVGINADDRVCGNCGTVLKEEVIQDEKSLPKAIVISEADQELKQEKKVSQSDSSQMKEIPEIETSGNEDKLEAGIAVLTLGDWLLTLLLLMIPVVNIVMLIVWSADSNTNPNKRHFAWAQLIFMGIMIVLSIIFSSVFAALIISGINSFY